MLSVPYNLTDDERLKIKSGWISLVNTSFTSSGFHVVVESNSDPPPPRLDRIHFRVDQISSTTWSAQSIVEILYGRNSGTADGFYIVATDQSGFSVKNSGPFFRAISGFQQLTTSTPPFVGPIEPSMGISLNLSTYSGQNPYFADCIIQDWGFALVISLSPIVVGTHPGCFFRYLPFKEISWTNSNWTTKNQIREFGNRTIEAVYNTRRFSEIISGAQVGQFLDESFLGQIFFIGTL